MSLYTLPAARQGELDERMRRLGRTATKLGLVAPTYNVVAEELRQVDGPAGAVKTWDGQPVKERWLVVEVDAPVVKLPGWEFLAVLQHTEHGNILRTLPGAEIAPGALESYRARPSGCDHCHQVRARNDTYLVRRVADQQVLQVGSSCLTDFLGVDVLASLCLVRTALGMDDLCEAGGGSGGSDAWYWNIDQVLALSSAVIRMVGWVSAGRAKDSLTQESTANVVFAILTACREEQQRVVAKRYPKVWEAVRLGLAVIDQENAVRVKAWVRALPRDVASAYLHNLRVACAADGVSQRELGLVASAVATWHREMERELERQRAAASTGWLGEVGDKVGRAGSKADLRAGRVLLPVQMGEVRVVKPVDGLYGVKTLVKVVTDMGATLVWWASTDVELRAGMRVRVAGTIKALAEFRGVKETVLTRATIEEVVPLAAATSGKET